MSFDYDPKDFDFSGLLPIEIPYKTPDGKDYVLKAANGKVAKQFTNARIAAIKFKDGDMAGASDLGNLEPLLVSLCSEDLTNKGRPVHQAEVEKWPYSMIKKLYETAKRIGNLDEEEDPIKQALVKALARPDTPVRPNEFRDWIESLQGKEYRPLQLLFKEEDESKNLQKTTMDGSE